ncbi:growth-regulated alpha protein [Genypterus blacodes]|uniref:growth-regulated alpha protein n=1 Tax=Genypterus blacodes TaxID=154954 RepID=UPI003F75A517
MITKAPLLVAVLTLSIFSETLQAIPRRCACIRTFSARPRWQVGKVEVYPVTGHCDRVEIIFTRQDGTKVCVNPDAQWVGGFLRQLRRNKSAIRPFSTAVGTTALN